MKNLFGVLKYIKGYWNYAWLNIVCNLFSVLFGIFSLTMVIPFLNLLFLGDEKSYAEILQKGAPVFKLSMRAALDELNYYFTNIIVTQGKAEALLIISISII